MDSEERHHSADDQHLHDEGEGAGERGYDDHNDYAAEEEAHHQEEEEEAENGGHEEAQYGDEEEAHGVEEAVASAGDEQQTVGAVEESAVLAQARATPPAPAPAPAPVVAVGAAIQLPTEEEVEAYMDDPCASTARTTLRQPEATRGRRHPFTTVDYKAPFETAPMKDSSAGLQAFLRTDKNWW